MNSALPKIMPYPGLRPYEESEEPLFFGRAEQAADMLMRLGERRFLAVVGASGAGKSSIVRAKLIPNVRRGRLDNSTDWIVLMMRPGHTPYRRLAGAILAEMAPAAGDHAFETHPDCETKVDFGLTLATLQKSEMGLIQALGECGIPPTTNVLLVVDQFEELFGFRRASGSKEGVASRDEASGFVKMLQTTCEHRESRVRLVITMRSDSIGDCEAFLGLPEKVNESQFLVPRLDWSQMREAIVRPSEVSDQGFQPFTFESGLIDTIISDAGDRPDQLPLMQHALMRMWMRAAERAKDAPVVATLEDYNSIGRISNALSLHADEALKSFLGDESKEEIARRLFLMLGDISPDGSITRQRPRVSEVMDITGVGLQEVETVVRAFQNHDRNFLVTAPAKGFFAGTRLDVSHEALFRQWEELTKTDGWLVRERNSADEIRRLAQGASLYYGKKGDLLSELSMGRVEEWQQREKPNKEWALRYVSEKEWEEAMAYLAESREKIAKAEQDKADQARRDQEKEVAALRREKERELDILRREHEAARKMSRLRRLFGAGLLLVLATGISVATWKAKEAEQSAEAEKVSAEIAKKKAREAADSEQKAQKALDELQRQKALVDITAKNLAEKTEVLKEVSKGPHERHDRMLKLAKDKLAAEPAGKNRVEALHLLANALRVERSSVDANRPLCELLTRDLWLPPLTPNIHLPPAISTTPLRPQGLLGAAFDPKGNIIAVSKDGGLWRKNRDNNELSPVQTLLPAGLNPVPAPNESNKNTTVINIHPGYLEGDKKPIADPALQVMSFSDDGRYLLVGHYPRSREQPPTAQVWTWVEKTEKYKMAGGLIEITDRSPYHTVNWSKDGLSFILTRWDEASCTIYQFDGSNYDKSGDQRKAFANSKFQAAAFDQNSQTIATIGIDAQLPSPALEIRKWNPANLQPLPAATDKAVLSLDITSKVNQLLFGPSPNELTIQTWGQPPVVIDAKTGSRIDRGTFGATASDSIMRFVFSIESAPPIPGSRRIAAVFAGKVEIFTDTDLKTPIAQPVGFRGVSGVLTLSQDGRRLLTLSGPTWNAFDTVRSWSLEPVPTIPWDTEQIDKNEIAPIWLADLAEAVSGQAGGSEEDAETPERSCLAELVKKYSAEVNADQKPEDAKYKRIWQRFVPPEISTPGPTP